MVEGVMPRNNCVVVWHVACVSCVNASMRHRVNRKLRRCVKQQQCVDASDIHCVDFASIWEGIGVVDCVLLSAQKPHVNACYAG